MEQKLAPIDIQRRLELREFFVAKNDQVSASLVDNMFKLASFDEVKAQVTRMYGELPPNWCVKDRYEKYKKMLKQGVSANKIKIEMAKDGLDPEEFLLEDSSKKKKRKSVSRSRSKSTGRKSMIRTLRRRGSMFKQNRPRIFKNKQSDRKGSLVDLQLDEEGLLKKSSNSRSDTESVTEKVTRRRGIMKTLKKKARKKKPPVESIRSRLQSSSISGSRRKSNSFDSLENSSTSTPSDQDTDVEAVEMTEEAYAQASFFFTKSNVEETAEKNNERSKSVYSTLTQKNQVGHLHNYVPFFSKTTDKKIRKSSVANIKRRMTRNSVKRGRSRATSHGIFYEDDGKALKHEIVKTEDVPEVEEENKVEVMLAHPPPKAAPRKRRTKIQL